MWISTTRLSKGVGSSWILLHTGGEKAIGSDAVNQAIGPWSVGHAVENPTTQIIFAWCLAIHVLNHPHHFGYILMGSKQITNRLRESMWRQDQSKNLNYKQQQLGFLLVLRKIRLCQFKLLVLRLKNTLKKDEWVYTPISIFVTTVASIPMLKSISKDCYFWRFCCTALLPHPLNGTWNQSTIILLNLDMRHIFGMSSIHTIHIQTSPVVASLSAMRCIAFSLYSHM